MLQSEFENLVKMNVSVEEYYHIEYMYNLSDLPKAEFCYHWTQMNRTRIAEYKAKMKAQEKHNRLIDRLWHIVGKYTNKSWEWKHTHMAHLTLCKTDIQAVNDAGIGIYRGEMTRSIADLLSDIIFWLKRAA